MAEENHYLCIEMKDVVFHAFHGLYEEEKKAGNDFVVNLSVFYDPGDAALISTIEETVNYGRLFELVKSEMEKPRDLLETIAMLICKKIKEEFSRVYEVQVSITKLNPPIEGFSGKVSVTYHKQYNKNGL